MIPKNLDSPISPFIATFGNFKDIEQYRRAELLDVITKTNSGQCFRGRTSILKPEICDLLKKEILTILPSTPESRTPRSVVVGYST